jgi:CRISPR system Cascade subunit CasD
MTAPAVDALVLLLDAPLMAFGVPVIDQNGVTGRFPGVSQMAGLLGNALGWRHADTASLQRLQERLRLAAVVLRDGTPMRDFQTVDLSQPHIVGTGWTTRGRRQDRGGGEATSGTHIRYRWYRAGEAIMVALRLDPPEERPTLADLEAVLDEPFRCSSVERHVFRRHRCWSGVARRLRWRMRWL